MNTIATRCLNHANKICLATFWVFIAVFSGCGRAPGGELTGVRTKKVNTRAIPLGMVYIPGGTFIMGQTDQNIAYSHMAQNKQVTVQAFYMDETAITNSKYRQFVNWVRDSIAITDYIGGGDFYIKPKNAKGPNTGAKYIDWKKVGDGSAIWANKKNTSYANKLDAMYYQGDDKILGKKELDVRLLKYQFELMDYRKAANFRNDKTKKRIDFIIRDTIHVYPDTLVWLADFAYAQNEPLVEGYFSHPAFKDYPVVGVNWRQARAFTIWRTRLYANYIASRGQPQLSRLPIELPTEAQFEYAARGGHVGTNFPWGGPYLRNAKGCLMANFKVGRGNYGDDGGTFPVHVKAYYPNDYGLYCMAGNVAEWTASTYHESTSAFVFDLNPNYSYEAKASDPPAMKRKVIRGGSWKDIGYFLQNSSRAYEYQDSAKSYIGFRCVTVFPGRDYSDRR